MVLYKVEVPLSDQTSYGFRPPWTSKIRVCKNRKDSLSRADRNLHHMRLDEVEDPAYGKVHSHQGSLITDIADLRPGIDCG